MGLVIALLVIGAILMILEIYLPGLVAGILGLLCLGAGVVVGYYELGLTGGTWLLIGVILMLLVGFAGWLWLFPRTRVGRAFISQQVVGEIKTERPDLLG